MQEIFTGHKITSGMLFGIKTEGQLGGRTELIEAWEHFHRTYVMYKQEQIETVFNKLLQVNGLPPVLKIKPIEPIGIVWTESTYISVMTKDELREKLGLPKLVAPVAVVPALPEAQMAEQFIKECGVKKSGLECVSRETFKGKNFSDAKQQAEQMMKMQFAIGTKTIEQSIVNILIENPKLTEKDIAQILGVDEADVKAAVKTLKTEGKLSGDGGKGWNVKSEPAKANPFHDKLKVMYDYVKRPVADGPAVIETTRDFCRAVIGADSYFDAQKIQEFSDRLGYDVFDRGGGWWTHDGEHDPQCRHEWNLVVVKTTN